MLPIEPILPAIADALVHGRSVVVQAPPGAGKTTTVPLALLDAEFRAWDGLDEDDAAALGFDLEEVEPPRGDSDEELLARMVAKLPSRH